MKKLFLNFCKNNKFEENPDQIKIVESIDIFLNSKENFF